MQVLLLDDDHARHEDIMTEFLTAGCHITATSSLKVAEAILTHGYVDLLIASERLHDRLTHNTALFAEHRNPTISTLFISDRASQDLGELHDLIPSLHGVVGVDVPGKTLLALGRASVASKAQAVQFQMGRALPEAGMQAAA